MLVRSVAALLAASLLAVPVAHAALNACTMLEPVPCAPSGVSWVDGACGDASLVQGFVVTSVEVLLIATGLGCEPVSVALP